MKSRLPRAARNYLEQLRRELSHLTEAEISEILSQTRTRINDLPGRGRRTEDLYNALGTAQSMAGNFKRTEPEALKVRSGKEFLSRILAWPILGFALLTAIVVLFAPATSQTGIVYSTGSVVSGINGESASFGYVGEPALAAVELQIGAQILWLALVPLALSLIPLILRNRVGMILQILGALLLTAVIVLGGASIGLFFVPVTILLWAQVLAPPIMMRGSMARPGPLWLILGALTVVVILAGACGASLPLADGKIWPIYAPALVLGVLAILLPARRRALHITLVSLGLLVISAGLVAALQGLWQVPLIWAWLAGGVSFAVGHLALAGGLWNERARNLLALF